MIQKTILMSAGVLMLIYGILVFRVGSGRRFFLVWAAAGAAALLLGYVYPYLAEARPHLIAFIRVCFAAAAVVLAALIVLIAKGAGSSAPDDLDCIVVLGAQIREDGPSATLKYRLDRAADYLLKNPRAVCVVSGGQGDNEPCSEAEGMRKYLIGRGGGEESIMEENRSENTLENIRLSMEIMGGRYDKVGIVTNDFHMFRALQIAKKQGIEHVFGIPAKSMPLYLPNNTLRECFGIMKDLFAGNLRLVN